MRYKVHFHDSIVSWPIIEKKLLLSLRLYRFATSDNIYNLLLTFNYLDRKILLHSHKKNLYFLFYCLMLRPDGEKCYIRNNSRHGRHKRKARVHRITRDCARRHHADKK